jgi:hypothetical protein
MRGKPIYFIGPPIPRISAAVVDGRMRIHTPHPGVGGMFGWLLESTVVPDAGDALGIGGPYTHKHGELVLTKDCECQGDGPNGVDGFGCHLSAAEPDEKGNVKITVTATNALRCPQCGKSWRREYRTEPPRRVT